MGQEEEGLDSSGFPRLPGHRYRTHGENWGLGQVQGMPVLPTKSILFASVDFGSLVL